MFSYIYADQSGVHCMQIARTQQGAEKLAYDNINRMVQNETAYSNKESKELTNILVDLKNKDIEKAIEAWNHYQTTHAKRKISYHKISPVVIVE